MTDECDEMSGDVSPFTECSSVFLSWSPKTSGIKGSVWQSGAVIKRPRVMTMKSDSLSRQPTPVDNAASPERPPGRGSIGN